MNYTAEQLARLPKWAQHEINWLESNLAAAQKDIAQMTGVADTDIHWGYRFDLEPGGNKGGIPVGEWVRFRLARDRQGSPVEINVRIRKDGDRHVLDINGDRGLVVQGRACNSIFVWLEEKD